jgi:hypothetical protein
LDPRSTTASERLALALAITFVALAAPARADEGRDPAAAESLFREGKALMSAGRYSEACVKFADSNQLDPGAGTLLALAVCHEKEGKTATAWAEFTEVLPIVKREGRADRERIAASHVAALTPKLSRLTIEVDGANRELPDFVVKRNGIRVGPGSWGAAVPVDPGEQRIEVAATGALPWSAVVQVAPNGDKERVVVPGLAPAPVQTATAPPAPKAIVPKQPDETPDAAEEQSGLSTSTTVGIVVGVVGVAALVAGSYLGVQAISKGQAAKKTCPLSSPCYDEGAVAEMHDAHTAALAADVVLGTGLAAIGVGAFLVLTGPKATPASARRGGTRIGIRGRMLSLEGEF